MDINSLNGANAYTNTPNSTPSVDHTQLREQNLEASRPALDTQNTATQAFEVSLTQEAQDRQAAETTQNAQETQTTAPENPNNETTAPAQNPNQIVNIVA